VTSTPQRKRKRGACESERGPLSLHGKLGTTRPRCDRRRVHGVPDWAVIPPYECGPTWRSHPSGDSVLPTRPVRTRFPRHAGVLASPQVDRDRCCKSWYSRSGSSWVRDILCLTARSARHRHERAATVKGVACSVSCLSRRGTTHSPDWLAALVRYSVPGSCASHPVTAAGGPAPRGGVCRPDRPCPVSSRGPTRGGP